MATKTIIRYRERPRARRRTRASSMTMPLAVIAGLAPMAVDIYHGYQADKFGGAMSHLSLCTTGFDFVNPWNPQYALKYFYGPMLLGITAHKLANKLGLNRALSRANIPFIRI